MHFLQSELVPGNNTEGAINLLHAAAPEYTDQLRGILDQRGVEIWLVDNCSAGPRSIFTRVQIPIHFIERMWLLAHAGWEAMRDFGSVLQGAHLFELNVEPGQIEKALQDLEICPRSFSAVKYAFEKNFDSQNWPKWIPEFQASPANCQHLAIIELWSMAVAWCLLHEVRHAMFFEDPDRPDNSIEEEELCDEFAFEVLMQGTGLYADAAQEAGDKVRGKRAMGILIGLYVVASLSKSVNESHPPPGTRIVRLMEHIGELPSAKFWDFAAGVIYAMVKERSTLHLPHASNLRTTVLSIAKAL